MEKGTEEEVFCYIIIGYEIIPSIREQGQVMWDFCGNTCRKEGHYKQDLILDIFC